MANRKRLDRKMDSQTYEGCRNWHEYRKWMKWGRRGNLKRFFKAGYE